MMKKTERHGIWYIEPNDYIWDATKQSKQIAESVYEAIEKTVRRVGEIEKRVRYVEDDVRRLKYGTACEDPYAYRV